MTTKRRNSDKLVIVQVTRVPQWCLKVLRRWAVRDGHPDADASAMRWAAMKMAEDLLEQEAET